MTMWRNRPLRAVWGARAQPVSLWLRAWARAGGAAVATAATAAAALGAATPAAAAAREGEQPAAALAPYAHEAQLREALQRWQLRALELAPRRAQPVLAKPAPGPSGSGAAAEMAVMAQAGAMAKSAMPAAPAAATPAAADAADSITNVQTAGVDEGGIVKQAGEHLVVLRRGRLFTVRVGGDQLAAGAAVDAFGPGIDPGGAWYDELLVSGRTVVVIGYSYARGGTEVGLFELAPDGRLTHRSTWNLRSGDYYSARNYASRLIGDQLIFYSPTTLHAGAVAGPWDAAPWMPGLRRWQPHAGPREFRRLLPATRIYRTDDDFDPTQPLALHTVTRCRLGLPEMSCESTAVLGPRGREFYVSGSAVYVWTHARPAEPSAWGGVMPQGSDVAAAPAVAAAVFRLPLDGAEPTALKTSGMPVDALSFAEDATGHLNVLLRRGTMRPRGAEGHAGDAADLALLRVPLAAFGDGRRAAGPQHYRGLPGAGHGPLHNRHIGPWLLWGSASRSQAWAVRTDRATPVRTLEAGHRIERVEALGEHGLLVGSRGDSLRLSAVRLGSGDSAVIEGQHPVDGVRVAESRTHGFFFRASGDQQGLLGLPVVPTTEPGPGWGAGPGRAPAASVLFLRQRELRFAALGHLDAQARPGSDGCRASCVDWYGQARPIFLGTRIFALLGYELVEGRLDGGLWREALVERRRLDFSPVQARDDGRYWPS